MRQARVRMNVADDVNCIRSRTKPQNLRIKTDRHIDVIFAGQEEQRIPCGTEFAVLFNAVDLVNLLLDRIGGHRRIEHQNIRPKVWMRAWPLRNGTATQRRPRAMR